MLGIRMNAKLANHRVRTTSRKSSSFYNKNILNILLKIFENVTEDDDKVIKADFVFRM